MSGWGLQLFRWRKGRDWDRRQFADHVNALGVRNRINVSLGERHVLR